MIGKVISPGATFSPCINYVFNGSKADREETKKTGIKKGILLSTNKCYGTEAELTTQFVEVSALNSRVNNPVQHMILSFAHKDIVTTTDMIEIAHKLSVKMGFDQHQFIAVKHNDKDHEHIHLVTNVVSLEGKTFSSSHNYQKISEFCREMEIEYNLRKVLSPIRFLPKEQRDLPRKDTRIDKIKEIVTNALKNSNNYDELRYELLAHKIDLEVGRGITFIDEQKVRVKGSKIEWAKNKIDENFLDKRKSNTHIKSKTYPTVEPEIIHNHKNIQQPILFGQLNDFEFEKPKVEIEVFKTQIGEAINDTTTWDEFQHHLQLLGLSFKKGRGINFSNNATQFKGSELGFSLAQIESRFNMNKLDLEINKSIINSVIENEKASNVKSNPFVLQINQEINKINENMTTIKEEIVEALNCSTDWEEFTQELADNDIIVYLEDDKLFFENQDLRIKVDDLEVYSKLKIEKIFEESGNIIIRNKLKL